MASEPAWKLALLVQDKPNPATDREVSASLDGTFDRAWIERIRCGDHCAFEVLFHAFYPSLCAVVTRHVGSRDVAKDLVQDVFVRVWERRDALDPEQSIAGYLYRAARNRALNHLKHRSIVQRSRAALTAWLSSARAGSEMDVGCGEMLRAMEEAIEKLPDRRREVFLLSRHGQLSYAEIAALLGISIKTVETQMGRALASLRAALAPYV